MMRGMTAAGTLTIDNARIWTATDDEIVDGAIHIRDGIVEAITDAGTLDGRPVLDARERVVIPGLVDAHFHAYGIGLDMLVMEATPLSYVTAKATKRLGGALRRGFTTVRDVAGGDIGLQRAIDEGLIAGPRYLFTGPALSQTGGHGDPRPGDLAVDTCCHHTSEVVDGVEPLRVAVRDRFRTGAHAIKIMTSGGVISLTDPLRIPQYSPEEVRAVCDEAIRRGSYVAAHAYSPEAIVHSVTNGVRSIEHGNLLDAATAQVMARSGALLVPTLATYDAMDRRVDEIGLTSVQKAKNLEVLDHGKRAIDIAAEEGVTIGFGTDLMGDLEDDQLQGLRLQHEVMGTAGVLRAATRGNAELIGDDRVGRVGEGSFADLVILARDPFDEPDALWDPAVDARDVVLNGIPLVAGKS